MLTPLCISFRYEMIWRVGAIQRQLNAYVACLGSGGRTRLADRLGLSPGGLSQKLSGRRGLHEEDILAICRALGLTLAQLEVTTMKREDVWMHELLQRILDTGDADALNAVRVALTAVAELKGVTVGRWPPPDTSTQPCPAEAGDATENEPGG